MVGHAEGGIRLPVCRGHNNPAVSLQVEWVGRDVDGGDCVVQRSAARGEVNTFAAYGDKDLLHRRCPAKINMGENLQEPGLTGKRKLHQRQTGFASATNDVGGRVAWSEGLAGMEWFVTVRGTCRESVSPIWGELLDQSCDQPHRSGNRNRDLGVARTGTTGSAALAANRDLDDI